jgi:hypothetical protein
MQDERTITRSTGVELPPGFALGMRPGGGYSGATADLDALVADAAELLRDAFGMDIEIRFNSDRESGGAWLKTPGATDVQIGGHVTTERAHRRREQFIARYGDDDRAPLLPVGTITIKTYLSRRVAPGLPMERDYRVDQHQTLARALAYVTEHARVAR